MLKGLSPLLNADVLYALRAMGHGDDLIVADTNFPSDSIARQTVLGRLLRIDNVTAPRRPRRSSRSIPLDSFVDDAAARMEIVGSPARCRRCRRRSRRPSTRPRAVPGRWAGWSAIAFYERAKQAYCVIQTGERRFYGCFALPQGRRPARRDVTRHGRRPASSSSASSSPTPPIGADRQPRMGETILGRCFKLGPGGKGSNQAVAAAPARAPR